MMKKTLMVILAAILMFSVFAGCGKENKEQIHNKSIELLDKFGELQKTMNVQEMVDLTPPEYYEYYVNSLISSGEYPSESDAREQADIHFGTNNIFLLTSKAQRLSIYDEWREEGYISYVHTGCYWYTANDDEVEELNSFLKKKFGFKKKVTAAEVMPFDYTIYNKEHEHIDSDGYLYGLSVKIDGSWYFVTDSEYWMTGDYGSPSAYVSWIYQHIVDHKEIHG